MSNPYDTPYDDDPRELFEKDIQASLELDDDEAAAEEIETHTQQFLEYLRGDS